MSESNASKKGKDHPFSRSSRGSRNKPGRGNSYTRNRTQHQGDGDASKPYYRSDYQGHGSYRGHGNYGKRPYRRSWSDLPMDEKRQKLQTGRRLKEPEIGVTEFIGTHTGFSGVIKQRYTDFHVNEINLKGEIAKFTSQDIPPKPKNTSSTEDLRKAVPSPIWEQLKVLAEDNSVILSVKIDVTSLSKPERCAVHKLAKSIPNVESQTIDEEDKKILIAEKIDKKNKTSDTKTQRWGETTNWKERGGEYCYFVLHKVNMDTMDVLNQLSWELHMRPNDFMYAGTKDRRAWTTQWVCLRKVEPARILGACRRLRGAYVGNFSFSPEPLKLGMLGGNRFRIALRNVTQTDEEIEKSMISLRDNGFINYYGLQRFGTVAAIPTYEIGKALLQGRWNEAIELILKPREDEAQRDLIEARKIYQQTKNATAALEKLRRKDFIEAMMLMGVQKCGPENPQGAIDCLPRNVRLMYLHAYQSFVWNHMVSRRIKEFGSKPIVGDLVLENQNLADSALEDRTDNEETHESRLGSQVTGDEESTIETSEVCANEQQREATDRVDTTKDSQIDVVTSTSKDDKSANESPIKTDKQIEISSEGVTDVAEKEEISKVLESEVSEIKNKNTTEESFEKGSVLSLQSEMSLQSELPEVKILTEKDLPHYTMADVVMPQPGWRVIYPPYAKEWYEQFLAKDFLTTNLKQKNKKYSLGGGYRHVLQIPKDLSWKTMHYSYASDDLIQPDIHRFRKLEPPKDKPDGSKKALILEFTLDSSTYATMALREVLRIDTSAQTQAETFAAANPEVKAEESKKNENNHAQDNVIREEKEPVVETINVSDSEKMEIESNNERVLCEKSTSNLSNEEKETNNQESKSIVEKTLLDNTEQSTKSMTKKPDLEETSAKIDNDSQIKIIQDEIRGDQIKVSESPDKMEFESTDEKIESKVVISELVCSVDSNPENKIQKTDDGKSKDTANSSPIDTNAVEIQSLEEPDTSCVKMDVELSHEKTEEIIDSEKKTTISPEQSCEKFVDSNSILEIKEKTDVENKSTDVTEILAVQPLVTSEIETTKSEKTCSQQLEKNATVPSLPAGTSGECSNTTKKQEIQAVVDSILKNAEKSINGMEKSHICINVEKTEEETTVEEVENSTEVSDVSENVEES